MTEQAADGTAARDESVESEAFAHGSLGRLAPTWWEPEEGEPLEPEEQESDGAVMEPASLTTEELEHMAVVKLRAVARQIGLTSMTRKEIRFAKKEELLAAITAFLAEQNN